MLQSLHTTSAGNLSTDYSVLQRNSRHVSEHSPVAACQNIQDSVSQCPALGAIEEDRPNTGVVNIATLPQWDALIG